MHEKSELQFKLNLLRAMASVADAELARKSAQLAQKDTQITGLTEESARKDEQIRLLTTQGEDKDRSVSELLAARADIMASTSWRVTAILRWLRRPLGTRRVR